MQTAHSISQEIEPPLNYPQDWRFGPIIGRSPVMRRLFTQMRHIARHLRTTTIEGEPGSGKMLAARALHQLGPCSQSPFVSCSAQQFCELQSGLALVSPRSTAVSDFSPSLVLRESANSTLVLTRVDELTHAQQARLLQLLQWIDQQFNQRAFDAIPRQIFYLSTQPLRKLAATAALRSDLAARFTTIRFAIPPLCERPEDIPLLAEHFALNFSAIHGKPIRGLAPQAIQRLQQHPWPGNVRELESAVTTAALTCPGQWIRPIDLPPLNSTPVASVPPAASPAIDDDPNLDRAILRHIYRVLTRVSGNKLRAAKLLGISRSTLYRLLDSDSASNLV